MATDSDHLYPPGLSGPVRVPTPSLSHERTPSSTSDNGYEAERFYARTPSPTPSENELIRRKGAGFGIDRENFRKYFTKEYIVRWIIAIVVITLTILIIVFDDKIIDALEPTGEKIKKLPAGFLIPIAIMIVLSFPPLFGAEIIHLLCGVIWGLGVGFAIVAAGTLLGEIANFYAFRICLKTRAEKYEQKNVKYGVLAQVVREGGFFFVVMCRLSALPAHFTTVLFTLSGINIFVFTAAAVISLVKVFASVYIGVAARQSADGQENKKTKIINYVIIGVTILITLVAMRYINAKVDAAKPAFIYARRKSRQHQPMSIHAENGEGFQIAAPKGQKGYGPLAVREEDDAHVPLYTGYPKEYAAPGAGQGSRPYNSQPYSSQPYNPYGEGGV
ncbi:hypothetical protein PENSPDRAFT_689185 [Peniophora sp. CONT]|nr:hypothetical protein PENSPDRAFT_689185 [Peniophora sp. CONT]